MTTAQRTLVKSPPEIWAEVSDTDALARHLGEFGEVRITRLEPETTVAWEGDRVRGTVALEASGWGTKVTLSADAPAPEPSPAPEPPRRGFFARLLGRRKEVVAERSAAAPSSPPPEAVLVRVLDDLGAAHKRPFAR